jgi:hypothetical protein
MKTHELHPRTLGASDYPSKTPLDEIISLMDECEGAIILGFPQIRVNEGTLKNDTISMKTGNQLVLPTEWNHIEAGLAYAKGLPLLVISHVGVNRGIFDRGAINNFIYEIDFSCEDWPLLPQISGAFEKWKKDVLPPSQSNYIERKERLAGLSPALPALTEDTEWLKSENISNYWGLFWFIVHNKLLGTKNMFQNIEQNPSFRKLLNNKVLRKIQNHGYEISTELFDFLKDEFNKLSHGKQQEISAQFQGRYFDDCFLNSNIQR